MRLADFDYELPPDLIAQHPAAERAASRLLHVDGASGRMEDRAFRDIVELVAPGDLLVFNDTKVIKARLHGRKDSGGEVEVLVERILDASRALAHVRASKAPKAGRQIRLARGGTLEVLGRQGELYELLRTSLQRDSVKDAVAHAVELSGRPRREIYARALELAKETKKDISRKDADGED